MRACSTRSRPRDTPASSSARGGTCRPTRRASAPSSDARGLRAALLVRARASRRRQGPRSSRGRGAQGRAAARRPRRGLRRARGRQRHRARARARGGAAQGQPPLGPAVGRGRLRRRHDRPPRARGDRPGPRLPPPLRRLRGDAQGERPSCSPGPTPSLVGLCLDTGPLAVRRRRRGGVRAPVRQSRPLPAPQGLPPAASPTSAGRRSATTSRLSRRASSVC